MASQPPRNSKPPPKAYGLEAIASGSCYGSSPSQVGALGNPSWLEAKGWRQYEDDGFVAHVGPFWINMTDDATRMGFIADDRHRNRRGNVQGGMIATLADRAMGQAGRMATGDTPHATIQLDLHYLDATRIGEFVEARCRVTRRTRHILFIDAEIMANGRPVAEARGIWKVLRPADEQNPPSAQEP